LTDPYLFGPIAARPVGDDADQIDAAHQWNVQELVASLHGRPLPAAQHVVDVELDIEADRELAAKIDRVEHARLLELSGRKRDALTSHATGTKAQGGREHIAATHPRRIQWPEQAA
jgi:hypothetical protein